MWCLWVIRMDLCSRILGPQGGMLSKHLQGLCSTTERKAAEKGGDTAGWKMGIKFRSAPGKSEVHGDEPERRKPRFKWQGHLRCRRLTTTARWVGPRGRGPECACCLRAASARRRGPAPREL